MEMTDFEVVISCRRLVNILFAELFPVLGVKSN
jgi:hypothetical protein